MKAVVSLAAALALAAFAAPAMAQYASYPDQARSWSSYSRYGHDFNGQADRPGDYRCDAYWDRGRADCGASWRDQRPFARHYRSGHGHGYGRYGSGGYVYQPYNQGTQYYGAYGRPDQVYPGSGYGGRAVGYASGSYSGGGHRDPGRAAWCASRYRSYDPASGYYRAYSGRLVFCG